jgi:hypothetical protein
VNGHFDGVFFPGSSGVAIVFPSRHRTIMH